MEINLEKFKGKELFVRKMLASFIEKIFNYNGYDLEHDRIKKVLYAEDAFKSDDEEKIKRAYDAYIYLVSNVKSPLTKYLIRFSIYTLAKK